MRRLVWVLAVALFALLPIGWTPLEIRGDGLHAQAALMLFVAGAA